MRGRLRRHGGHLQLDDDVLQGGGSEVGDSAPRRFAPGNITGSRAHRAGRCRSGLDVRTSLGVNGITTLAGRSCVGSDAFAARCSRMTRTRASSYFDLGGLWRNGDQMLAPCVRWAGERANREQHLGYSASRTSPLWSHHVLIDLWGGGRPFRCKRSGSPACASRRASGVGYMWQVWWKPSPLVFGCCCRFLAANRVHYLTPGNPSSLAAWACEPSIVRKRSMRSAA